MAANIPEWATPKQKEGMTDFYEIASEYGYFNISFKAPEYYDEDDDSEFFAVLTWGYDADKNDLGVCEHTIRIVWNYEQVWDCYGDELNQWQFVFAGGDATREMDTESLFLDLFFYMDKIANTRTTNQERV